jgi:methyl-accepting chemotaxis protein
MSRRILAPLKSASEFAQRIAVGDLRSVIDQRGTDETGDLMRALASMQDGLRAIVEKVGRGAGAVASAAQSMAASSDLIEDGSRNQSNAAQATATSIEQLSASIAAVADGAEQVRAVSEASLGHARDGAGSLGDLNSEIKGMQLAVNDIAGAVSDFVQSARTIDGMTQQVTDIAEQTNLLALNAAIEAARAGEQGRGFAVVADEVRKLAEKSAAAAREINTVTQSLGERSERVSAALVRGNAALGSSQAHAKAVSDVLIAGEGSANQASHGVGEITRSVREQRAASEEIARNVEQIARMAEDNVRAVSKAAGAARNLGALADELNESVGHFKII